jgi:hypothetical protein
MQICFPDMPRKTARIAIGLLFLLCGAVLFRYFRQNGQHDFMPFYLGAKLAASGHMARLYDPPAYQPFIAELRSQGERLNKDDALYFIRPAFEALLYVPLTWLPYRQASLLALVANFGLLGLLIWKLPIWFNLRPSHRPWIRCALAIFYPFLWSIAVGQDTLLLTLLVSYALVLESKGRQGSAGIVLGLCAWKPHLIWLLPLALLAGRRFRMAAYSMVTGSALLALSFGAVGMAGMRQWAVLLQSSSTDIKPFDMGNIRALTLSGGTLLAASAVGLLVVCFCVALCYGSFYEKFSAAVFAALLVSPHTYWQDYSLMALIAMITTRRWMRVVLLLPWPFLYSRTDELPMIAIALGCMTVLASAQMPERWPILRKQLVTDGVRDL